jgi:hypothetical protein
LLRPGRLLAGEKKSPTNVSKQSGPHAQEKSNRRQKNWRTGRGPLCCGGKHCSGKNGLAPSSRGKGRARLRSGAKTCERETESKPEQKNQLRAGAAKLLPQKLAGGEKKRQKNRRLTLMVAEKRDPTGALRETGWRRIRTQLGNRIRPALFARLGERLTHGKTETGSSKLENHNARKTHEERAQPVNSERRNKISRE